MNANDYVAQLYRVDGKPMSQNVYNILAFIVNAGYDPEQMTGIYSMDDIAAEFVMEYYHCN